MTQQCQVRNAALKNQSILTKEGRGKALSFEWTYSSHENINQEKVKEWKYIMKNKYLTKYFRSKPTWLSFGQMLCDNVPDKVKQSYLTQTQIFRTTDECSEQWWFKKIRNTVHALEHIF